jgi:hypothetical protein
MSECSFKLGHYLSTVLAYQKAGYSVMDFAEYFSRHDLPEKLLILRHDIDFAIDNACRFSDLEFGYELRSSMFVRLHSANYNALSYGGICALRSIGAYGTTFGWHAEPDIATLANISYPETWMVSSIGLLNSILPSQICAISLHCVTKGMNNQRIVDLLGKSGVPLVTHSMPGLKYLSDSNGRWREGCFCQWIDKAPRLHVLTHPIWWFHESPQENY